MFTCQNISQSATLSLCVHIGLLYISSQPCTTCSQLNKFQALTGEKKPIQTNNQKTSNAYIRSNDSLPPFSSKHKDSISNGQLTTEGAEPLCIFPHMFLYQHCHLFHLVVTLGQLVFFLGWDWGFAPNLPSLKWIDHKVRYMTLQLKQESKMKMTESHFPRACKSFQMTKH